LFLCLVATAGLSSADKAALAAKLADGTMTSGEVTKMVAAGRGKVAEKDKRRKAAAEAAAVKKAEAEEKAGKGGPKGSKSGGKGRRGDKDAGGIVAATDAARAAVVGGAAWLSADEKQDFVAATAGMDEETVAAMARQVQPTYTTLPRTLLL
jgi:hypothetical protein